MISLLYITLNEEKYIERSIESVKKIVNEIVIIDAFSTDKTFEICSFLDAKVFLEKWKDDFSYARNFGIKKCKEPWILTLDADEHFEGENINLIPHAIKQMEDDKTNVAWEFPRKNHYPSHEADSPFFGPPFYPDFQVRLFRNRPEIFYSGRVHEGVKQAIEGNDEWWIGRMPVHIHHHLFRGDREQFEKTKEAYYITLKQGAQSGK